MTQIQVGRADIIRLIQSGFPIDEIALVSQFIGLRYDNSKTAEFPPTNDANENKNRQEVAAETQLKINLNPDLDPIPDVAFWAATRFSSRLENHRRQMDIERQSTAPVNWSHAPDRPPVHRPLAPWNVLEPRIRKALQKTRTGRQIDLNKMVQILADGQNLTRIPMRPAKIVGQHLTVVADRSNRLVPFWNDQTLVSGHLEKKLPSKNVRWLVGSSPDDLNDIDRPTLIPIVNSRLPGCLMILGDLGLLESYGQEKAEQWYSWLKKLNDAGCRVIALVPFSVSRIPKRLRDLIIPICWSPYRSEWVNDVDQREQLVTRIFQLLAPAIRIEPGLLRDIRLMVTGDASIESDVWQHRGIRSQHSEAATLEPEFSKRLMDHYQTDDQCQAVIAFGKIKTWRQQFKGFPYVWFEEVSRLNSGVRELLLSREEIEEVHSGLRSLYQHFGASENGDAYVRRLAQRMPEAQKRDQKFGSLITELCAQADGHAGVESPFDIKISQLQRDFQMGDRFIGSPVAKLSALTNQFTVTEFRNPCWASAIGHDQFGPWCEFEISGESSSSPIVQRMRWIRPGRFLMGSSETEEGRDDDEGPQRNVTLTQGYWLFDTPVTQELWNAVMGESPSKSKGSRRPVEQVSWEDTHDFISRLNGLVKGLELGLPSEAQWEYACRAGSVGRWCFGEDESQLSKHAWYSKNSENETHGVGEKLANAWGLFDMHGNVWEWCQDFWSDNYVDAEPVDPIGPIEGHSRVLRGGSWRSYAQSVRSAIRNRGDPGNRVHSFGFRCAQVQDKSGQMAEPDELSGSVAEQRPGERSRGEASKISDACSVALRSREVVDLRSQSSIPLSSADRILIQSDCDELEISRITKPRWASAMGRDRYGLWSDFELAGVESTSLVRQRLRWIPPGRFLMGSPETEGGRFDDEGPQRNVTLTQGYWLFDTPVTQELWNAVMGENPSHFKGANNPVENVSWDVAQNFIGKINKRIEGVCLGLPSEAQWEYACRAGSVGRWCFGEDESQLSKYAWYDGNSENETHPVGEKFANAWGLYDMHGNVREWCWDYWSGDYTNAEAVDPTGPVDGHFRVLRGGSWSNLAQSVRSAYRNDDYPGNRFHNIGFRCAQVQNLAGEAKQRS